MNKTYFNKFFRQIKATAISKGLEFQQFTLKNDLSLQIITHTPKQIKNSLLVVWGLHGNEIAWIYWIKEFISEYNFNKLPNTKLVIFSCMNPYWFLQNQRKNKKLIDLNRILKTKKLEEEQKIFFKEFYKTKFQGFLSLHEDYSTNKAYFYCYNEKQNHIYRNIQQEVWKIMKLNTKNIIDGNKANNGIIYWHQDKSLENFLYKSGVEVIVCSETGQREDFKIRINANKKIIISFIENLKN